MHISFIVNKTFALSLGITDITACPFHISYWKMMKSPFFALMSATNRKTVNGIRVRHLQRACGNCQPVQLLTLMDSDS